MTTGGGLGVAGCQRWPQRNGNSMGSRVSASCLDCGHTFTLDIGGGFSFHLLRCSKCGRTKTLGFDELGDLHVRYVKSLGMSYCSASAANDK